MWTENTTVCIAHLIHIIIQMYKNRTQHNTAYRVYNTSVKPILYEQTVRITRGPLSTWQKIYTFYRVVYMRMSVCWNIIFLFGIEFLGSYFSV